MAEQRVPDQIASDQAGLDTPPLTINRYVEWLVLLLCATSFAAYLHHSKAAATYVHRYLTMWEKLRALLVG